MRIALVIPYNPLEEIGGLEIATVIHAKELIRLGHKTTIFTKGTSGMIGNVSIYGYPSFTELCFSLLYSRELFDVFHWMEIFPGPGEVELQGMVSGLLRSAGKKTILMVATSGNLSQRGAGCLATPLLKSSMDAYVVSNPDQLSEFAEYGIVENVHIIGFGVDTSLFKPVNEGEKIRLRKELNLPPDKVLCLFVGRFVERKRPDFLLRAWMSLAGLYNRTELIIVGSGMDQHDSMEEKVRQIAMSVSHVDFRDITRHPEEYYQACDLLLLPSSREGQPNVLMEMMACGNPVIGSDIAGIRELLANGVNGLLFSVNDAEGFTKAVERLVDDKTLRRQLGGKATELIRETKDVRLVTAQYTKLYGEG